MKLRINKWLGYSLAALTLLGLTVPASQVSARQTNYHSSYRVAQYHYTKNNQHGVYIKRIASIPAQGYTNYVTGDHALYTLPGTINGTHRLLTKSGVKKLADRNVRFMAYRVAVTNKGSRYFKIVSLHHSIRGWIYETDIRSILNRNQQKASLNVGNQINYAEIKADENKHKSLVNHSTMSLVAAQKHLQKASKSAQVLKNTPDYQSAGASIKKGYHYLKQVKSAMPNAKTLNGIITIRSEYQKAAKDVAAAQAASSNHQNQLAKQNIKAANRSLHNISTILNQIHNKRDRRAAMKLFNQALSYVNNNYSFNPATNFNAHKANSQKLSNKGIIKLITIDENKAQASIMDLYPHLNNFDVTLADAYQAQSDLNQANDLVSSLKGTKLQQAVLADIQQVQHNINALWNV